MNIPKQHLNEAARSAKSYKEFRENLKEMGHELPFGLSKFPMNMKSWGRKLRYEFKQIKGKHLSSHDLRQGAYYDRLERLGCPEPLNHM